MKITKISISDFHQFQSFELDLTYPKGHEKAGKPLDKVCFIGQSGTGKTTILELIRQAALMSGTVKSRVFPSKPNFIDVGDSEVIFENRHGIKFAKERPGFAVKSDFKQPVFQNVFYFPSGLPFIDVLKSNDFIGDFERVESPRVAYQANREMTELDIHDLKFDKKILNQIWDNFFVNIQEYQEKEVNFKIQLVELAEKENLSVNIKKEMENWREANFNPLKEIANACLNKILNKFQLEVETEISDVRNLKIIQIKSLKTGEIIPFEKLSTGTKQIIFTAFPIYYLPKDETSVILIDEPENSLYPDIQKELIDFYTSFDQSKGEKTQFFFATHSPIIASSFEPWEIVELKFDGEGKIYRKAYFAGENHVDNYKIDPRYLRWDDILATVFDMKVDGNGDFRPKKLMEYAILKRKVEQLKKAGALQNPTEEVQRVLAEFRHASDLLTGKWDAYQYEKN